MTPDEIAEQLVTEWQAQDKMPPMAWDFRGFAAAAASRAAEIEREACAKVCEEPAMTAAPYSKLDGWLPAAEWCASAIRARSNA